LCIVQIFFALKKEKHIKAQPNLLRGKTVKNVTQTSKGTITEGKEGGDLLLNPQFLNLILFSNEETIQHC